MLARDRLGVKPLYLARRPDGALRFASTLPALVAGGGVDTSVDPVALHHYLSLHSIVPPPRTILRGVRKLPPATVLVVEPDGTRRERRWWDPPFTRDPARSDWSAREWEEALLAALRTAVERRMVADVPVGVLLSGGLDSSLIVALLARGGQRELATFSIGFPDAGDREGDEFAFSDLVAREFGTEHHQIRVGPHRLVDALPDAIRAMSEPMVSHDASPSTCSSEEVARAPQGRAVRPGRRRGARRLLLVPADARGRRATGSTRTRTRSSTATTPAWRRWWRRRTGSRATRRAPFAARWFGAPGAASPVDRALRIDAEVMLVDDPVKRVDT